MGKEILSLLSFKHDSYDDSDDEDAQDIKADRPLRSSIDDSPLFQDWTEFTVYYRNLNQILLCQGSCNFQYDFCDCETIGRSNIVPRDYYLIVKNFLKAKRRMSYRLFNHVMNVRFFGRVHPILKVWRKQFAQIYFDFLRQSRQKHLISKGLIDINHISFDMFYNLYFDRNYFFEFRTIDFIDWANFDFDA